ncbi:MAG: proprotein convertase P-domain-containing protein [Bacteroidia bacterium]|nr:proprotein convertase P-domain-containing protein [Bacteroidia bacterium]
MKQIYKIRLLLATVFLSSCFYGLYAQRNGNVTDLDVLVKRKLALVDSLNNLPDNVKLPGNFSSFVTGPEQDCRSALQVCNQYYIQPNSYTGYGSTREFNGGTCLLAGERQSVWYVFTVQNSGTFGFTISTTYDYDFALYNLTAIGGCSAVPGATPVRCNFAAPPGTTGLRTPQSPPGPANGATSPVIPLNEGPAGNPWMPGINVTAGTTYALIVDNYTQDQTGYRIDFYGTAQIFDNTPPAYNGSLPPVFNCATNQITVNINEDVFCSSIAANGSDFSITGPSSVTILSAVGVGCGSGNNWTRQIILTIDASSQINTGAYTISSKVGTDGNTLLDKCGNAFSVGATAGFTFTHTMPTFTSTSVACSPSRTIRVNLSSPVKCSSIASNGSDFTLTGPGSATVTAASGVGCPGSGSVTAIDLTFTAPTVSGSYTLNLASGTDGNTLLAAACNPGFQMTTGAIGSVNLLGNITVTGTTSICSGSNTTLTLTNVPAGATVSWSPASGTPGGSPSGTTYNVTPSVTTNYTATITYGTCIVAVTQAVSIVPPPVVSVSPKNPKLCTGGTVNLVAAATGAADNLYTFIWSMSPGGASVQTNTGVATSTYANAGAGTYYVRVTATTTGCVGNETSTQVTTTGAAPTPTCNVYYVTTAGGGNGLSSSSPTDIVSAVNAAQCTDAVIKMAVGDYTIDAPLNITSFMTVEGGYNSTFTTKTSSTSTSGAFPNRGTRIIRRNSSSTSTRTYYGWRPGTMFGSDDFTNTNIATITQKIYVYGQPTSLDVTNMTLAFRVIHTYCADMRITLTSPVGTTMNLVWDNGGSSAGFNVTFVNSGGSGTTASWPGSGAMITGSWRPQAGSFAAFAGQNPNGYWTITVNDKDITVDWGQVMEAILSFGAIPVPNLCDPGTATGMLLLPNPYTPVNSGLSPRVSAFTTSPGAKYFRLQDLTVDVAEGTHGYRITNYGIYIGQGSSDYDITRCVFNVGSGSPGVPGENGVRGRGRGWNGEAATDYSGVNGYSNSWMNGGTRGSSPVNDGGAGGNGTDASGTPQRQDGGAGAGPAGGAAGAKATNNAFSGNCCACTNTNTGGANAGSNGGGATAAGANGASAGTNGSAYSYAGYFINGTNGTNGDSGADGSGGGGGGGGARDQGCDCLACFCTCADEGNGGAGGGGGGEAGTGGKGAIAAGASFGVFSWNKGANANVTDCIINAGTANGSLAAGTSALGGTAGIGGTRTNGSDDGGWGGNGGNGSNGGNGQAGGSAAGATVGQLCDLNAAGNTATITAYTNFTALTSQPVLQTDNKSCTQVTNNFNLLSTQIWNSLGGGDSLTTPVLGSNSVNIATRYKYNQLGWKSPVITTTTTNTLLSANLDAAPSGWITTITNNPRGTAPAIDYIGTTVNPGGYAPAQGTGMLRFNSYSCENGDAIRLRSSSFSTSGYTNLQLTFNWFQNNRYPGSNDNVTVQYSTDGVTFTNINTYYRYNAATGWTTQTITLPVACNGQATLYLGFLFNSLWGDDCHMDNITLTGQTTATQTYTGFKQLATNPPINDSISVDVPAVCPGVPATFTSVRYNGVTGYSFAWSVPSPPVGVTAQITSPASGQTGITFTNANATPQTVTVQLITTSQCCGPLTTMTKTITVNPSAGVPVTVNVPACVGGSFTASVTSSGRTFFNSLPAAIPDNSCVGATSTITVSGMGAAVPSDRISVMVNLTHTWDGDLELFLVTPGGQRLGLSNRRGGSGDNYTNTVFTDSAITAISSGSAPFTGVYRPETATYGGCTASTITTFGAIGGGTIVPNGNWSLVVYDRAGGDVGTVISWYISFPGSVTPAGETYNWYTTLTGGTSIKNGNSYTIPSIASGANVYYIEAQSSEGCPSPYRQPIVVWGVPMIAPTVTVTTTPCLGSNAVLTVSNDAAIQTQYPGAIYRWWDAASGGTNIGTGTPFTTAATISIPQNFWVEAVSSNGCVSPRTQVVVTPTQTSPTIANGTACAPGIVTMTVTNPPQASVESFNWYTANIGGTLLQSSLVNTYDTLLTGMTTATLYVSVKMPSCTEGPRVAVTATVTATPGTLTWTGNGLTGANNWIDPNNWGGCVPSCATNVIIPNTVGNPVNNPPRIGFNPSAAACNSITIQNGNSLRFEDDKSELNVCGDFNHNGQIIALAGGKIRFTGAVTQNYNKGISATGDLPDVVINNTAPSIANRKIIVNQTMRIQSTAILAFISGWIKVVPAAEVYLLNSDTSAISGYNINSYVAGSLRRTTVATGKYDFPVGLDHEGAGGVGYQLMTLNFTATNNADNIRVDFKQYMTLPSALGVSACGANFNMQPLNNGMWTAEPFNAALVLIPNASYTGVYNATLRGRNFNNAGGATSSALSKTPTGMGTWALSGSCISGSVPGNTMCSGLNSFSDFNENPSADPLPVVLLDLQAAPRTNFIAVTWETSSEFNNAGFDLERSLDGSHFTKIAWKDGHGTTTAPQKYFHDDLNVKPNVRYYYRLRQVDLDGRFSYSNVVEAIIADEHAFSAILYPNPTENELNVALVLPEDDQIDFTIYNSIGQKVYTTTRKLRAGTHEVKLDLSELAVATYQIKIKTSYREFIDKLVKVK